MKEAYHNMLTNTFKDLAKTSDFGQLTADVLELLMVVEREQFLSENASSNKANGFYSRYVKTLSQKLQISIPRDRLGQFSPMLLEVMKQESNKLDEFALGLYAKGVSQRDVSKLLGDVYGIQYSASKLSSMVKAVEPIRLQWQQRPLQSHYHVLMIDAVHLNVRRDSQVQKEAVYIIMGLDCNFKREILSVCALPAESAFGWDEALCDLKKRGVHNVGMVVSDELSGITSSIHKNFPKSHIQHCLIHKLRQLMSKVRSSKRVQLSEDFKRVFNLNDPHDTQEKLRRRLRRFIAHWGETYPRIARSLPESQWRYYCSYLVYPFQVRRMLYTTNWIERFNKEVRKVTKHTNSFPNEDSMVNLVYFVSQNMYQTYQYPISNFHPVREEMESILYTL